MNFINWWADLVLLLCLVPIHMLLWTLLKVPWWKSDLGLGLFSLTFSLAMILDLALIGAFVGRHHWTFEGARAVTYTIALVGMSTQVRAFRRILATAAVDDSATHRKADHDEDRTT